MKDLQLNISDPAIDMMTNKPKFFDLIKVQTSVFIYKFHNNQLEAVFANYFISIFMIHNYKTRLSTKHAYALPTARTNYGTFNVKFHGEKLWNSLDIEIITLSIKSFKTSFKQKLFSTY